MKSIRFALQLLLEALSEVPPNACRLIRLKIAHDQRDRLRLFFKQKIQQLLFISLARDVERTLTQLNLIQNIDDFFCFCGPNA